MKRLVVMLLVLLITGLTVSSVYAQEAVTVPDLTGLSAPKAAAELNRLGLRLGAQASQSWTADSGVPENTIGSQSVEAGSSADPGTAIDVTILRSANIRLIYDDNDLTVVNLTPRALDISGINFATSEGSAASFSANRWTSELKPNQCVQVWSINRNGPKGLPECESIQAWQVTTNAGNHFWTAANGVAKFDVKQGDGVLTTCNAASAPEQPMACEVYLVSSEQSDVAEFVYFVYTTDQFVAANPSENEWMRLNQTKLYNANPNQSQLGANFNLGTREMFGNPDILADVRRLAPKQCLLFKSDAAAADAPLPETCDVIAQRDLPAAELFWLNDFQIESRNGTKFTCTAAVEGKRTICVMPR